MHTLVAAGRVGEERGSGVGQGNGVGFVGYTALRVEQTMPGRQGAAIQGFSGESEMGKQFTRAVLCKGLLGCGVRGGARAKNRFWQNVLLVLFCLGGAATARAA